MSVYAEIKKYLLYLVGAFCILICLHIGVLYLYNDAVSYPLPGGTINVGIISDDTPTLDVTQYETKIQNNTNDVLLRFLYRGVLRFSLRDKKIVGDIASCNLDTFPTIRCKINEDAVWNTGEPILNEDILATYSFFKEKAQNESTKNRLSLITVSEDAGEIVFSFKTRDATVIEALFLPIIRKKDIDTPLSFDTFSQNSFSGPFVFFSYEDKKNTYLFRRNPYYSHEGLVQYFDQIRFGFAPDESSLTDTLDSDVIVGAETTLDESFLAKNSIRPVFYGIFFNTSSLSRGLRNALKNDVVKQIDVTDVEVFPVENIFLGDVPSTPVTGNENLFLKTLTDLGYSYGGTAIVTAPEPAPVLVKNLNFITSPGKITPLFMSDATIEIAGKTPAKTTRVVVNDYTLKNFDSRAGQFSYKAQKDFNNLINGENVFRVSFYAGNNLISEESVTVYYNTNTDELARIKADWKEKNTPKTEPKPVVINTSLDPKKLYSKESKILSFSIIVQSDVPYFEKIGALLSQKIQELGGEVELKTLSVAEIRANLQKPDFRYDMIISGVNLGLFHYNIAPYFHSGQIKEGFNLSNVRDPRLDGLLEKLTERLYYGSPDKLRSLQDSIQKYIEQESLVFSLGSPYEQISIRENVLGKNIPEYIPGEEMLIDILSHTYFKQGYRLSPEGKNIFGFIEWLKNALFPPA